MEIVEKRSWLARVHRICDENGWQDTATMAIFSTINGYHEYRRSPGVGGTLNCTPEPGNRHDMHAVVVKDLDGVTIGHVPRNICNVISTCLNIHHILVHAKAFYTGGIVNDGPVQGGGQKLPCIYLLKFVDFNGMKRAGDILKMYIPNDCLFL